MVLGAACLWLGGLTFYAAFVIPVLHDALGSHREAGFVTRTVTLRINLLAAIALPLLTWDLWLDSIRPPKTPHRVAVATLVIMALAQATLFYLHRVLDSQITTADRSIDAATGFYQVHRVYLLVTAAQWTAGLVHVAVMLSRWRRLDGRVTSGSNDGMTA